MNNHTFINHGSTCPADINQGERCAVCDGGLKICSVCNGAEGTLTTHCPQVWINGPELDEIYARRRDYKDGTWQVQSQAGMVVKCGCVLHLRNEKGFQVLIITPCDPHKNDPEFAADVVKGDWLCSDNNPFFGIEIEIRQANELQ